MISVSSSDARKDLGLGFGGRAGKMEENEAEDGGAPSCSNGRSSDSRDDPDIALSYIDDKLENILGHFQKDFEGGISVENLGAKFGGYGSFLPMYELSPVRSHPKSPQEVQSHFILRSPNNSRLKESRSYCSASKPARPVCISRSTSKAPSSNVLAELKECVNSSNFGTSPEHKNLRVCIKVGSNDLTSQKNVLAFSEQGVDPSSLTFLEKSLSEGDEGFHGGADNSPTTILMAMISFPLHTDLLLSPLSDDLIQLGEEKGITTDDSRYFHIPKLDSEISHFLMDVPDSQNCDTMLSTAKKEKLTESVKVLPLPSSSKADGSCIGSETDKETDMQLCEELVFKTLRLPLLSCLSPMYIHPEKKISKVSDACVEAVEGTTQGVIRTDLEAALTGSKPGLEESVVAFSAQSVKETKNGIFLNRKRKDLNSKEGEFLTVISESKRKKAPNAENTPSSMDKEGIGESEDRYRKFCGDMGKSKEEIQSRLVDKVVKGKPSKHNVSDKSLHSEPQLLIYSSNAPPSTFRSISDVGLTISASTMIEDNWVLCEKCQKWRLLPNGMNPDSFPEDWDCSMLSWLPGMNCCTIHQDLTTEAVLRMHRAPSIEIQKAMNRNPGSTILVCNGEILENLGKEKERKSLKEIASRKDKEMHNNLPLVSEPDSKHLTKSNDSSLDGSKIKQNDTWRLLNQLSGEGEMKMERDLDRELCGTSKKPKTGESRCFVVDQSRSEKILKGVASDKTELTQAFVTEDDY
ncbi:PREDICTED: uncharacterized protein LOC104827369 [Tarenaya hassleriana]|uniref:uncharacterized protein LOC104827369 n=1 Tax=Tarenaya hassleriana TaxID=28532 RepID=UPI00053C8BF2|nr:PREDICTED: uncharacterized protein LOC104827369 [Tarenaya hassleriana]